MRRCLRQLQIPKSRVHKVLHNRLKFRAYKVQIIQLKPDVRPKREKFTNDILNLIDEDNDFLQCVCISDEATFHIML
jgi:hypothetical protein